MSKANDIALELASRLADISVANGYNTDCGLRVFRGRRALDDSRFPCIVLHEGADVRDDSRPALAAALVTQKFIVEAHLFCDPDNPNDAAHDAIADIKRAVFSRDLRMANKVQKLQYDGRVIQPRDDGMNFVSAQVAVSATYSENLSDP